MRVVLHLLRLGPRGLIEFAGEAFVKVGVLHFPLEQWMLDLSLETAIPLILVHPGYLILPNLINFVDKLVLLGLGLVLELAWSSLGCATRGLVQRVVLLIGQLRMTLVHVIVRSVDCDWPGLDVPLVLPRYARVVWIWTKARLRSNRRARMRFDGRLEHSRIPVQEKYVGSVILSVALIVVLLLGVEVVDSGSWASSFAMCRCMYLGAYLGSLELVYAHESV